MDMNGKRAALFLSLTATLYGGPYPPAAGQEGSGAIALGDERIVSWATMVESFHPDESVSEAWLDSEQALGPAEGNSFGVCSLGPGGTLTVSFGQVIPNRLGPELAVFENSFSDLFLELSFVEVSSDGVNFVRFPNRSLTPSAVGSFGAIDTTDITGFAGKYRQGFGTPFDFSDLPDSPLLDADGIRFVRLVDVVGGQSTDSSGAVVYDPYPTSGSAGFDCDGIALLAPVQVPIAESQWSQGEFRLSWASEAGKRYAIESTESLERESWTQLEILSAEGEELAFSFPTTGTAKQFFRVVSE
ncbi:hypothetical protein GCM10007100_10440 [Roseibacillus persicicus]|uniref:Uncharacterized protein n=2 Tax=Roseibacillus persicicus TaxID=454148 RepID=A0A918THX4_9BACT|nr:hypothetical protein GCM10007100_10440 [Roseibacillus persicicus]